MALSRASRWLAVAFSEKWVGVREEESKIVVRYKSLLLVCFCNEGHYYFNNNFFHKGCFSKYNFLVIFLLLPAVKEEIWPLLSLMKSYTIR